MAPAAPAHRAPRLSMLDVLRFLAALSVVGYHYTVKSPAAPEWEGPVPHELVGFGTWAAYGAMGVSLFFVISGFVILMTAWGRDVPHFVASRIGRLFPGYWVSAAVAALITVFAWPQGLLRTLTKGQILLNFTMLHGAYNVPDLDRVYWTLFYEARFYVLLALFMLIGITRQRVLAFAALWPIVGAIAQTTGQSFLTMVLMPDYAPFFAGGMLLYVLYRDGHDLLTWLLVGMNAIIAVNFSMEHFTVNLSIDTGFAIHKTVVGAVAVACFALVALVSLTPVRRLHARWMVVAGALSYPLYLLHQTTGWYLIHVLHHRINPWMTIGIAAGVAMVMAALLHYLVERPLGHRLRAAVLHSLRRGGALTGPRAAVESVAPALATALPSVPLSTSAVAAPAEAFDGLPTPVRHHRSTLSPHPLPRHTADRHAPTVPAAAD